MTIMLYEFKDLRSRFGGGDGKAINKHSVRYYEYFVPGGKGEARYIVMDRNLSTIPPSFTVAHLPRDPRVKHEGPAVFLKNETVNGAMYFGEGETWKNAIRILAKHLEDINS